MSLRKGFNNYYVQKKYKVKDANDHSREKIVPFISKGENIFKSEAILPSTYWLGAGITGFYTLILFLVSYFIFKKRLTKKRETLEPEIFSMEEGDMVYIRCCDRGQMDQIYNYYREQEDTVCIDEMDGKEIDAGLSISQTARYYCKLLNAREDRTFEHLEKLGLSGNEKEIFKRLGRSEIIKRIYCAVCMAVEKDTIVFKNFLDRESREFEVQLRQLLFDTMEMDRKIIYLGLEVPIIDSAMTAPEKFDTYTGLRIKDPRDFIFR